MNVLTNPLLFADIQGNSPPVWSFGSAYEFSAALSGNTRGLSYIGAPFKLPKTMTFRLTCGAGTPNTVLTVTATSRTMGEQVTTYPLTASTVTTPTLTLPDDVLGLRMIVGTEAAPYAGTIATTLLPLSAVARVFPANAIGRTTTAYVSGWQRNKIHESNLFANEVRPLVADFNGAMDVGRVLASARWDTYQGSFVSMSQPVLTERKATVMIASQYAGEAVIKCSATLDNGQILVQQFLINVEWQPLYPNDVYVVGPSTLTVNA